MERFVNAPSVYLKVVVKSKNFTRVKFIGQMDQAGVCEINLTILILSKHPLDMSCSPGELERNLKGASYYILKNRLRRTRQRPQEITALSDHGFTSHQGRRNCFESA